MAHRYPEDGPERWTRQRVLEAFRGWQAEEPEHAGVLDAEALGYVRYHALRYARLLTVVGETATPTPARPPHILDVGPNVQTALLRRAHPEAVVDTLGFAHPAVPPRAHERHVRFDLNEAVDPQRRPELERRYDVIVLAEVIEHLHTPPAAVLEYLGGSLDASGVIVLQTPNGAALHKRLALLRGRNPVEPPRACRENPGHVHEYTLAELAGQVRDGGLRVLGLKTENYFGSGPAAELYRRLGRLLPPTVRHGVTLCAGVSS
ncbi:MAG: methyltransferase domain-containing protein [Solirubrobacteraceae bacterium]